MNGVLIFQQTDGQIYLVDKKSFIINRCIKTTLNINNVYSNDIYYVVVFPTRNSERYYKLLVLYSFKTSALEATLPR